MTETPPSLPPLEILRRELDDIDDNILSLLIRRFGVTGKVKALKQDAGTGSPLRPAREAQILRRILSRVGGSGLPPELVLRLWRAILAQSSMTQAPITLHVSRKLSQTLNLRLMLRDHFAAMKVEDWRDDAQAMMQVNVSPGDICAVEPSSPWAEPFIAGKAGSARVIGTLPLLAGKEEPALLIIGNAPMEATGADETLVISNGNLPRDFALSPLWQAKSGTLRISALAGFFADHDSLLMGLARSNAALGLRVAGRYPSAFEV